MEYVKNKDLLREIILSKKQDILTPTCEKMFIMMVDRIIRRFKYYNEEDREDCRQGALLSVFTNWRSFNTDYKNPFAYITEIIKRGLAAQYNSIHWRKGMDRNERKPTHHSIQGVNDGQGMFDL